MINRAAFAMMCLFLVWIAVASSSTRVTKLQSNSVEDIEKELNDIYRSIPNIEAKRVVMTSGTYTDTTSVKYRSPEDFIVIVAQGSNEADPDLYVTNSANGVYVITREATGTDTYNVLIIPTGVWGR